MTAPTADSLVPLRDTGDLAPLYCIHPVSGSPYCYSGLVNALDPRRPAFGLEAPGFDGESEPAGSIAELAERHAATLLDARPEGPFLLLGWSLGGVLAYETARLLTAAGREVPLVVVIDAALRQQIALPPENEMVRYFLHDFLGVMSGMLGSATGEAPALDAVLDGLGPAAGPAERLAAVEASGAVPEEFDAEFLLERFTLFRAHVTAMYAHTVASVHDGPAVLIRAAESNHALMEWKPFLPRLSSHVVTGDHHSIWREPGLGEIGAVVSAALEAGAAR
ncbi:alpha/beta fold hydrolase [Streptomyces sanyensis]|uniref:thioesterase domain-containing protein n=1 Tax=Streptomyces sanyensis TaxID=568869 RepID=UPI003D78AB4E